ncbi:hypothetical protein RFI_23484 [Reticulomyxa filosa]|uniref:Tubulin-tyrosine ligase family protein n=1 Tax=Reticulomyxa filosa TaxID=46433 RepID=X6MKD0_RETFI|nr:hypothetical protein RFI_23484 [Reticulomyxa filosa]|eukprot:ETO13882.1 hypothetical protein RFI_23484 [Reticulomyxa filosa]
MAHRLNLLKRLYPQAYDFYPTTLPFSHSTRHEAKQLLWQIQTQSDNKIKGSSSPSQSAWYLVKTSSGRQGTGIKLVVNDKDIERAADQLLDERNAAKQKEEIKRLARQRLLYRRAKYQRIENIKLKSDQSLVLQEYNDRPLLWNGFKFDFRVFAIVTSLEPFEFFVLREGIVRICTSKYQHVDLQNRENICMHFTNFHVNQHNVDNNHDNDNDNDNDNGNDNDNEHKHQNEKEKKIQVKRSIDDVLTELSCKYGPEKINFNSFWKHVDNIITKTLLTFILPLKLKYSTFFDSFDQKCPCFHIIGFDILLDEDFKLWLLEVNDCPSVKITSLLDFHVKKRVFDTVWHILRDIKNGGVRSSNITATNNSNTTVAEILSNPNILEGMPAHFRQHLSQNKQARMLFAFFIQDQKQCTKSTTTGYFRYQRYELPSLSVLQSSNTSPNDSYHFVNEFRLFERFPILDTVFTKFCGKNMRINVKQFLQFIDCYSVLGYLPIIQTNQLNKNKAENEQNPSWKNTETADKCKYIWDSFMKNQLYGRNLSTLDLEGLGELLLHLLTLSNSNNQQEADLKLSNKWENLMTFLKKKHESISQLTSHTL